MLLMESKPYLSPASCPLWLPTSLTHHIPPRLIPVTTLVAAVSNDFVRRLPGAYALLESNRNRLREKWSRLSRLQIHKGLGVLKQTNKQTLKYHQQCITIPIYSDIDHSNTQYSSTLEVSKKLRFLDANCLSDALAFQKKNLRLMPQFFLTTALRAVLIY